MPETTGSAAVVFKNLPETIQVNYVGLAVIAANHRGCHGQHVENRFVGRLHGRGEQRIQMSRIVR